MGAEVVEDRKEETKFTSPELAMVTASLGLLVERKQRERDSKKKEEEKKCRARNQRFFLGFFFVFGHPPSRMQIPSKKKKIDEKPTYLSREPLGTLSMYLTCSSPSMTLPKTTCLPSSHEVTMVQMKNWEPLVSRPELAIESVCVKKRRPSKEER